MKLALIGFGGVGQGLAEILRDKADELREQYGFQAQIVAVATGSRGALYQPNGLDIPLLLNAVHRGHLNYYPTGSGLIRDWEILRIIKESNADVVVEASPTDLQTGQPAIDHCRAALQNGKHVVTVNKGPIALAFAELTALAKQSGKHFLFEGTVMAGTPSIRLARQALAGCSISEARGIVNGTTNYILTQMESGLPYAEALAQAQALGYAETDPSGDVEGWDAAGKVIILAAALFGKTLTLSDLSVQGITGITPEAVEAARAAGERWKLIAHVTPEGGSVRPVRIPNSHPLASVSGATNAITFATDLLGEVTLIGAGAGRVQTGFAVLSDLLEIHRQS
jgi:homoserine dehydrogenase